MAAQVLRPEAIHLGVEYVANVAAGVAGDAVCTLPFGEVVESLLEETRDILNAPGELLLLLF